MAAAKMGDMEEAELGEYESLPDSENNPMAAIVFLVVVGAFAFALGVGMHLPVFFASQEESGPSEVQMLPVNSSSHGVSEKRVGVPVEGRLSPYPWTNAELQWQHTAFHFQPEKNWMNDPNGPLYYKGWYHLFYQYNPESAVWGNITWAHAVSRDLIHWLYLDLAMIRDQWYDINGVWTGSATVLPDGRVIMMYTGCTNESVQVQNLAFPEDPLDPLLQKWVKAPRNPVLLPPHGIGLMDFRDPTTAWLGRDGLWRICIGSKAEHRRAGVALVYRTRDFSTFELQRRYLHEVEGTGMWECVDFYPVASSGTLGLNTSASGFGVKHVLKASLDDDRRDYYAIGTYEYAEERFAPDDPEMDVGLGLRYDYGEFYASKTFFDPVKQRRILWGWVGEMDSEQADLQKEWASLQAVPRTIWFDSKTGTNLIQWPVEEIELLRTSDVSEENLVLGAESVVRVNGSTGAQLDVEIVFDFPQEALSNALEEDAIYSCSSSGGAAERGALGPFGLLVLADDNLIEQTAVYFYITKAGKGQYKTHICNDGTRSSVASDLIKQVHGNIVTVLSDEKTISLRVLVDHSIVETYAQGGRTCITSRVYPTRAVYNAAHLFLFNNGTTPITVRRLDAWQMVSVFTHPYGM